MIDNAGFEGGKQELRERFESYGLLGRFNNDRRSDHNMNAATQASVAGVEIVVARRARKLTGRLGAEFAGNQLHARKQEDGYCDNPKNRDSRGHGLT